MNYLKNYISRSFLIYFSLIFFSLLSFLSPQAAFAQAYGSGTYGSCSYNDTSSCLTPTPTPTSSISSIANSIANIFSQASAPVCGMTPPAKHPQWLYAAIPQDGNSIMLYFTDAD